MDKVTIIYRAAGPMFWAGDDVQNMLYDSPALLDTRIAVLEEVSPSWLRGKRHIDIIVANPFSSKEASQAILKYLKKNSVELEGIVTFSEEVIMQYAQCIKFFGVPGPEIDAALCTSANKAKMKSAFHKMMVPTPEYKVCESALDIRAALYSFGLPAVIKPTRGGGSFGVYKVDSPAVIDNRINRMFEDVKTEADITFRGFRGPYLVEEFVPGCVLSVDGIVIEEPFVCGLTATVTGDPPMFLQEAAYSPPHLSAVQERACKRAAMMAVKTTGIKRSAFHCELVLTEAGPYVLEIACRAPGGYLTQLYKNIYGYDLINLTVRLAQKSYNLSCDQISPGPPTASYGIALSIFPLKLGRIINFPSLNDLQSLSTMVDFCHQPIGAMMSHPANNVADVLLLSQQKEECWRDYMKAKAALTPRISGKGF